MNNAKVFGFVALFFVFFSSLFAVEQTLAILKPDSVQGDHIGEMLARYEKNGLRIAGLKMTRLSKEQAEQFYAIHKDRPFYSELVNFMSSGPVVAIVLQGDDAVAKNRKVIGATDPKKADAGTLRADFAESMGRNAVHGSDTPENAKNEVSFFFKPEEIFNRF